MNLLEKYVSNITDVKLIKSEFGYYYKIKCNTDCHGNKLTNTEISVMQNEFDMIMSKGYYLCLIII